MTGGHRGPSPTVQRAMGWLATERADRPRAQEAFCDECKAILHFDVPDPMGLGRSMESCSNCACKNHTPHPMTRQILG